MRLLTISFFFPDIVATNGDWSTEDTIWFSERVVNSQFVTKILDVIYDPLDDNVRISVSLIDNIRSWMCSVNKADRNSDVVI